MTIDGSEDVDSAIQTCISFAAGQYYYSIDLHYLGSTCSWECVAFINAADTHDAGTFNIANPDVVVAYGYYI